MFWGGWAINEKMFIALLIGYLVFAVYSLSARRRMPPLEFKAGSWFPLWIAGLAVISYLGDIDPDRPAAPGLLLDGGDGPLGLLSGGLVLMLFSAVIYAYAMATRLSSKRAAANISQLSVDEPPRW